jgi:hypothetical protein
MALSFANPPRIVCIDDDWATISMPRMESESCRHQSAASAVAKQSCGVDPVYDTKSRLAASLDDHFSVSLPKAHCTADDHTLC